MSGQKRALDSQTAASVTIAWTILANKPFYPLYVWWLLDRDAAIVSLWTLVATPFFAAVPFLASRSSVSARLALVVVGISDTAFASAMLGIGTGGVYFFFPCLMLAALCFTTIEKWRARALTAVVFVVFAALAKFGGPGVHAWTASEAKTLADLNLYCAIALSAFIALRFSDVPRKEEPLDA